MEWGAHCSVEKAEHLLGRRFTCPLAEANGSVGALLSKLPLGFSLFSPPTPHKTIEKQKSTLFPVSPIPALPVVLPCLPLSPPPLFCAFAPYACPLQPLSEKEVLSLVQFGQGGLKSPSVRGCPRFRPLAPQTRPLLGRAFLPLPDRRPLSALSLPFLSAFFCHPGGPLSVLLALDFSVLAPSSVSSPLPILPLPAPLRAGPPLQFPPPPCPTFPSRRMDGREGAGGTGRGSPVPQGRGERGERGG